MAVPGKIDSPLSKGSNRLIKEGAKLIESVEDVMEALGYIGEQMAADVSAAAVKASEMIEAPLFDAGGLNLSDCERMIYDCLSYEPLHVEQIIASADLTAGSINGGLISLQLKGLVKQLPGSLFLRK